VSSNTAGVLTGSTVPVARVVAVAVPGSVVADVVLVVVVLVVVVLVVVSVVVPVVVPVVSDSMFAPAPDAVVTDALAGTVVGVVAVGPVLGIVVVVVETGGAVVVVVAGTVVVVVGAVVVVVVVAGTVVVVVVDGAVGATVVVPYPPKSRSCPAASAVMAAPARPPGAVVVATWFHDEPFQLQVSSSSAPLGPRPPKRISCEGWSAVS
jgi:hypothetical protein